MLLLVVGAFSVVGWLFGVTRHWWASSQPDPSHPYGVRFRGGETLFFSTPVGWWLDNGLWVFFAVFGFAVFVDLLNTRPKP